MAKRKVCNGEEAEGRDKGKERIGGKSTRGADCTFAAAAGQTSAEQCTTAISSAATTAATTAKPTVRHVATTNCGHNATTTNTYFLNMDK